MHPISKTLFLSLVVLIFAFSPVIGEQPKPDSNLKVTNVRERDLLREKEIEPIPGLRDRYPSTFNGIEPIPYTEPFEYPPGRDFPYTNSTDAPFNLAEQRAMKAIIEDFLVNDDNSGGCGQWTPAIARDPSGNFVIVWQDDRNGNSDIFAQRYNSSGVPLGSNFKVSEDSGSFSQYDPAIAIDDSGNFVITWVDNHPWPDRDIYARRYNPSGSPLGSAFKVNADLGSAYQGRPAIAMNGAGRFVITWQDSLFGGNWDIYAQTYNTSGVPSGPNFKVNTDTGSTRQIYPSIAIDSIGNFIITWEDWRPGSYADIYAQRYDPFGNPIDYNFRVNNVVSYTQGFPAVTMNKSGKFVIAWHDERNITTTHWDIYARVYNSSGSPVDTSFRVNDDVGTADQGDPAIVIDSYGNFIITWEDDRNGLLNTDIFAQRFHSSGTRLGVNFKVNDDAGTAEQYDAAISMDGSGNFVITWQDARNGEPHSDIYAQRYDSGGNELDSNFKVNNDVQTAWQFNPTIAVNALGNFVIAFADCRYFRSDWSDIYTQRYDTSGTPLDTNFKVNADFGTARQYYPAIAMNGSGNFVITWHDERNGNWDIYAQVYGSSGTPSGPNFKVNTDIGTASQYHPAVAMDNSGNFVITWMDSVNGNWDIYARRYDPFGNPICPVFRVNDPASGDQIEPDVAMNDTGTFIITWYDSRNWGSKSWDIYFQRYNSSCTPLGSNIIVNYDGGVAWQERPDIAMDDSGNFVIAWEDLRNGGGDIYGNWDIYAQRFNSAGNPFGDNFKVNNDSGSYYQWWADIAMNDYGNFVITWLDPRNGEWDIYTQRYISTGAPFGGNYLVPDSQYVIFTQRYSAVAANRYYIYYTWQDNRRAKGWDIYAKVTYFLRGDVNGDNKVSLSDVVYLINYLFKFGPEPIPEAGIGDANCDGKVSISDIVYLINYLFKFGPPPCL